LLSWYEANDFIVELNNTSHLGSGTWQFPGMDVNVDAYIVKCSVATDEIECRDSKPGHTSVVYGAEPENQLVFDNVFFNYWSGTDYDADNIVWPGGATCNAGDEGLCARRQGFGGADSQNYVRKTYDEPDDGSTLGYSARAVASGDALVPPQSSGYSVPA
jgi:hypothetical protein